MPSKIEYQTWSGGSGMGDRKILIGYCDEDPREVLEAIHKTHYVYHYKDLYRPVDYNYPNNCLGLLINYISPEDLENIGIAKVVSYNKLNLDIAIGKDLNRNEEVFKNALSNATSWHIRKESDLITMRDDVKERAIERNHKMLKQLEEVKSVTLK